MSHTRTKKELKQLGLYSKTDWVDVFCTVTQAVLIVACFSWLVGRSFWFW